MYKKEGYDSTIYRKTKTFERLRKKAKKKKKLKGKRKKTLKGLKRKYRDN